MFVVLFDAPTPDRARRLVPRISDGACLTVRG